MKKFLLIIAMLFSMSTVFAQSTQPRSTAVIVQELRDNYAAQQIYIEELKAIGADKDVTIEELREKVMVTSNKLDKSIADDAKKAAEIIKLETQKKLLIKWLTIAVSILGAFFLLHLVILFIRIKWNVVLPYWLNALL